MKPPSPFRRAAALAVAALASLFASGCGSSQTFSPDALGTLIPDREIPYSFYVESAEGTIVLGGASAVRPESSEINRVLCEHFPTVFNRNPGSIPLHVEYSGVVAPDDEGKIPTAMLNARAQTGGKVTVRILIDDQGDKRVVHIPWRRTSPLILCFDALGASFVAANEGYGWPEVKSRDDTPTGLGRNKDIQAELMAAGVVKALNKMTPAQMAKLVARTHRTAEQRRLLDWLASSPVQTFSVDWDGALFIEAEHVFTPVPVDFSALGQLPRIAAQDYDAATRKGRVIADVTGCDEKQAVEYLLGRLVPEICRTKAVVFNPVEEPPAGAQYKVESYLKRSKDGKDYVQIKFVSLM